MRQQLPQDRAEWDKMAKDKVEDKKVSTNESKVKGLGGQLRAEPFGLTFLLFILIIRNYLQQAIYYIL